MKNVSTKLKNEILEILSKSELEKEDSHAENTLYWVKKIKPEASLALQIAALGHDIERGRKNRYKREDFPKHNEYKKAHSEKGAQILEKILIKHKTSKPTIERVKNLVRLHEVGGDEDADVLMDADSISFFDNNLEFYYNYKGPEETKRQMDYKFNRCTPRAQEYILKLDIYKRFKEELSKF